MSKIRKQLTELRALGAKELQTLVGEEREALRSLMFKIHTQEVKQVHLARIARKRIARACAILKAMK